MTALAELQSRMLDALLGRGDAQPALALLRDERAPAAQLRLQVYRNNLFESLGAALEAVHPVVARLVGPGFFRQAASAYARAHPSRSGDLHDFGDRFAAFLRGYAPATGLPYLGDVAALEWACHEVYHAADAPPADLARLAAVPLAEQPRLMLRLKPAARLLASPWPVLAIWRANQPGSATQDAPISLDAGGVDLLVVRGDDFAIELVALAAAEFRWLEALRQGRTLAEATRAALEADAAFDLAGALARHLASGLIGGFVS
jgi:hypothetical protein